VRDLLDKYEFPGNVHLPPGVDPPAGISRDVFNSWLGRPGEPGEIWKATGCADPAAKELFFKLMEKRVPVVRGCALKAYAARGKDLEQNTVGTFNVLEAMRKNGIARIAFSSTGSVYGESPVIPTPEDAPFPVQTSLYGASKLAGEGLIGAYCEAFGIRGWIFRFVSILGERYSHGHVFDFCKSLFRDPSALRVLGDGTQRKSYLYVKDCVEAIMVALEKCREKVNILNLGTDEYVKVNVVVPKNLTESQKVLLRKFADEDQRRNL
jgi:nucleoside-diphosphate-sugar epimerase